jgi:hypothetical protein
MPMTPHPHRPRQRALRASSGFDCYYANNTGGPARVRVTELDANTPATALLTLAYMRRTETEASEALNQESIP